MATATLQSKLQPFTINLNNTCHSNCVPWLIISTRHSSPTYTNTFTERAGEGEREGGSEEATEVKVAIKKGQRANTQLAYQ